MTRETRRSFLVMLTQTGTARGRPGSRLCSEHTSSCCPLTPFPATIHVRNGLNIERPGAQVNKSMNIFYYPRCDRGHAYLACNSRSLLPCIFGSHSMEDDLGHRNVLTGPITQCSALSSRNAISPPNAGISPGDLRPLRRRRRRGSSLAANVSDTSDTDCTI
jgi:hypothetical protein